MENSSLADLVQPFFDATRDSVNLKELLDISCEELGLENWEDLAGFLIYLDRSFSDTVEPKLRGMISAGMRNLVLGPHDWILIYLRMENAVRLLRSPCTDRQACPGHPGEPDALLWALTTFWHTTYRTEIEFAAKRHYGIPGCR